MAEQKPWEKYAGQSTSSGPWEKYGVTREGELGRLSGPEFARGIPQGARDVLDSATQMLDRGAEAVAGAFGQEMSPRDIARRERIEGGISEREKAYQASRQFPDTPDFGRAAGNVAATLPLAAVPGAGATGVAGRLAAGGAAGAGGAALSRPVEPGTEDFWKAKGEQALPGALAGAGLNVAGGVAGRVISPRSSPDVQTLLREGITPTPGQITGGMARGAEERLTSIPFIGDIVRLGERRALLDFNRSRVNDVLKPAGLTLPKNVKAGNEAVEWAGTKLSNEYDNLLPKMTMKVDKQFNDDYAAVWQAARKKLSPDMQREFQNIIDDVSLPSTRQATWGGEDTKTIISKLGRDGTRLINSPDKMQQRLGQVVMQLRKSVKDGLVRNSPVEYGAQLNRLDESWGRFIRVQRAAASKGAPDGAFTPAQYRGAVRAEDPSLRKGSFASGTAQGQEVADAAHNVLSKTVPDSGTAGRALMAMLATGGGGLSVVNPYALAGLGAATLPYMTRTGQKGLAWALAGRQGGTAKVAAEAARGAGRIAAPAAGAASSNITEASELIRYLRQ